VAHESESAVAAPRREGAATGRDVLVDRAGWLCLAALLVASVAVLLWVQRDGTLKGDEFGYALRLAPGRTGILVPPVGKYMIPIPLAVYWLLLKAAGTASYLPYQVVSTGFVALCGVLFFLLARRRIGWLALAPTAILLFFGDSAEVVAAGGLRLPDLMATAAGLGMLLALERRTVAGDALAAVLLLVSLFSHPTGLAFVAVAAVLVVLRPAPERWRRSWVAVAPLVVWAIVWFAVRPSGGPGPGPLYEVPGFMLSSLLAATAATVGATRPIHEIPSHDHVVWALTAILALAAGAAVWFRLRRGTPPPAAFWAALAGLAVLWIVTALAPGGNRGAAAPRYMFTESLFLLLVLVELADGLRLTVRSAAAVGALTVAPLVLNVVTLGKSAVSWRIGSQYVRAEETSLELARGRVAPDFLPEDPTATPWVGDHRFVIDARTYYEIASAWGSPAYPVPELLSSPPAVQRAADIVLARAYTVRLASGGGAPSATGQAPQIADVQGGTQRTSGSCAVLRPTGAAVTGDVAVPPDGLLLRAPAGLPQSLVLHRFGPLPAYPLKWPSGQGMASLAIPRDLSSVPWRLRVAAEHPLAVCSDDGNP
jgi:hypothetical protein